MMELYSKRVVWVEKAKALGTMPGNTYIEVPPEPWKAKGRLPKHMNMMLDRLVFLTCKLRDGGCNP